VKELLEKGYGNELGLCANSKCTSYKSGCSVTSVASLARRSVVIAFSATMPSSVATVAEVKAAALKSTPQKLSDAITSVKTADSAKFASVSAPTASQIDATDAQVTTDSVSPSGDGSSGSNAGLILVYVIGIIVFLGIAGGVAYYFLVMKPKESEGASSGSGLASQDANKEEGDVSVDMEASASTPASYPNKAAPTAAPGKSVKDLAKRWNTSED